MKKLAVYAEGKTEQEFAEKLLIEIAGRNNIRIVKESREGGGQSTSRKKSITELMGHAQSQQFYARLVNCGNDDRVQSDIRDEYIGLCREGFSSIIGIRDARGNRSGLPVTPADVPQLKRWIAYGLKTKPVAPTIVLAVMEIETWFLAEHTHFARIDGRLTFETVSRIIGYDLTSADLELRPQPAEEIDTVYRSVGKRYDKSGATIRRTVDALDYSRVYLEIGKQVPQINPLVAAIDEFLSSHSPAEPISGN